jgi:alkylhydroperoxidase/carboxymuconolactone decarboxylase family protein YurZ
VSCAVEICEHDNPADTSGKQRGATPCENVRLHWIDDTRERVKWVEIGDAHRRDVDDVARDQCQPIHLAEVDLEALKRRNDRWEAEHRQPSRLDRKTEELIRIAAYVALRNPPHHIQIHVHSAHKAGATPEEIYQVIDRAGGWAGGAARQNGMEAWRLVFRPDLPTIERVVELTEDSFAR